MGQYGQPNLALAGLLVLNCQCANPGIPVETKLYANVTYQISQMTKLLSVL